jgi:hypothetical protein
MTGTLILLLIGFIVAAPAVPAAVLCQTRASTVTVRTSACRKKEKPVDLAKLGIAPPDTPDRVRTNVFAGTACPGNDPADVMVRVGNLCVDVYEASVWSAPTGGTQYGHVRQAARIVREPDPVRARDGTRHPLRDPFVDVADHIVHAGARDAVMISARRIALDEITAFGVSASSDRPSRPQLGDRRLAADVRCLR